MIQIKIFNVSIFDSKNDTEDLNKFLRGQKILEVVSHFLEKGSDSCWSFCVKYLYNQTNTTEPKQRVDYKNTLEESVFQRFTDLRQKRKIASQELAIPAYAVFTDEELSELAKIEKLTESEMLEVKGIGKNKVLRYGKYFIEPLPVNAIEKMDTETQKLSQ